MKHSEFGWKNSGGLQIYAQSWLPEVEPAAIVCLVHGQGEHSSRYTHVAAALTEASFGVITFDHQGHGQSQGRRGDMSSHEALLDDIDRLLDEAAQRFSDTLCFLYGHSMGGNLVLNHVLRRQPALSGVVVTSPWLHLAFDPPAFQLYLVRLLSFVWPTYTLRGNLDTNGISRDPAEVAAYDHDPLNHGCISIRQLVQVNQAGQWVLDHAQAFPLPLLLTHGSADSITNAGATRQFADNAPRNCTFKLWAGLYHETHNEPEKQQVIAYIIDWLQAHIA